MAEQSLTISFANKVLSERQPIVALMLEQEEFDPWSGYLTLEGFVKAIANRLYSAGYEDFMDCGTNGEKVTSTIFAYPYDKNLQYALYTSYGELSVRSIEEIVIEEIVNIQLNATATIKYPLQSLVSTEWIGAVWDEQGNVIGNPSITIMDKDIQLSNKVYGSLLVKYNVIRHRYTLISPRRELATDNYFSSVVYGVYTGGISWISLATPQGADLVADGFECGSWGGSSGSVTDPNNNHPLKTQVYASRVVKKDYCSQEIISDVVNGV